jgi:protein SCO1
MNSSYSRRALLALGTLMTSLAFSGCSKSQPTPTSASQEAASAEEKSYEVKGEIVEVKPAGHLLVIHHQAIRDYMPEMTMEFKVGTGDLANAKSGQHIRGRMYLRNGTPWLEDIWPDDTQTNARIAAATNALTQDTTMRGKEAYREVGEVLPDFTLLDQEGRAVSIGRFRGKQVMLNFIFTRCPVANMCPAATMRMSSLQKAARKAGVTNLELISISFDPEHDSPGVLKEYAQVRGLDLSNWTFLTGPDAAVRQLLTQMGIIREFDGETIKHTLATLLIDEKGQIKQRIDGSGWDVQDFIGKMKKG